MTRRPTFSELRWPDDPSDAGLPIRWAADVASQVLDLTWRAFDKLQADHLVKVDFTQQDFEQLERDLTSKHFYQIALLWAAETGGDAAFVPDHECPENESRSSAPATPPAYDLAFVSVANQRVIWPLEAKVVPSPGKLAGYLKDVNDKFIGGVAAPLVGEGGMIAYLLTRETEVVFENLATKLAQVLAPDPRFSGRPHRVSRHSRASAPDLRLHHMLMQCV
jgi:hypothetical protein